MKQECILVINCGSSSLKFSLMNPQSGEVIISGLAERLMSEQAIIKLKFQGNKTEQQLKSPFDHQQAISSLVEFLTKHQLKDAITAIGHRVVHGGEEYAEPTLITEDVKATIQKLSKLAPLHNPANLIGINACQQIFTELPQVAIFDTAFHQTMPKKAFIYGIPYESL